MSAGVVSGEVLAPCAARGQPRADLFFSVNSQQAYVERSMNGLVQSSSPTECFIFSDWHRLKWDPSKSVAHV